MRLGESRLVNAGLVCADAPGRIEIRKDPSAIDLQAIVRHEPSPFPMNLSWQTCKKRRLKQTLLEALALSLAESDYSTKSTGLPISFRRNPALFCKNYFGMSQTPRGCSLLTYARVAEARNRPPTA